MSEKYYQLGTHSAADFNTIHHDLCNTTSLSNVPDRVCSCHDDKLHSPTRGTFLLTDEEAEDLKNDPRIKFINIDYALYPDDFKPPPDELYATPLPDSFNRWNGSSVKVYREFENSNLLPGSPGAEDYNRTSWSLLRHAEKLDKWVDESRADNYVYSSEVTQYGDGADVDVIVADDGAGWIGHPEFQNNTAAAKPLNYVGGNKLPGNGTCDILDLCLDAPYYLDPWYFDEFIPDPEYNNGAIGNVSGDGSDFFKREVTTNGVRIMGAGSVGGQVAVPDAWLEKVARMFELFLDPNGAGINGTFQREFIKTLSGDAETYHAGFPTIQRVARGAGDDYSTNFLTDAGAVFWNLTNLYDTHVQNDMVWYLNSTGDGYGDGDIDAQEVIEHVFHTLHMHGLPAEDIKLYPYISSDWQSGDLYAAMEEAYDAGKWDPSGYQPPGSPDEWKTDGDAFEVAAKEYLYLLNFCMFEYTSLWDGGSLSPEWTDDMRTQAGIQANNPLGYAFHNTYIAPVISKPSLTTIRSIFQDGNTPVQDDPSQAGASGYFVSISDKLETRWDGTVVPVESFARNWWRDETYRSETFKSKNPNAGVVGSFTDSYTRSYCNGSNAALSNVGTHCTPCMALTYGKTQGWAYNSNKWALNLYGFNAVDIEVGFDMQKIFHNVKPVNAKYGTQDPTVSSNSWGYRANKAPGGTGISSTLYYKFRGSSMTSYTTETGIEWLSHMGLMGDSGRWKSEMKTNSYTTALDELIDSGVIFVCAAGNSNQKQVNWDHQDYNNYIADSPFDSLEDSSFLEFGISTTGTTNRRGFPQQGGKETVNQATFSFNATAPSGTAYYRIVGTDRTGAIDYNNGPITVRVGDTIELTNDASSSHTMFIKTTDTVGAGDQVAGATGQGAYDGSTISWTPTEAGTYYYKCLNHSSMGDEIRVTDPEIIYKTINIGALDDEYATGNLERKVNYSDRGNGITAYFAADGTLAANRGYTSEGNYPDTYPGMTYNGGVATDCAFGGTSAACPVGAGFIATLMQFNRGWTYAEVQSYFAGLDNQDSSDFYIGTESATVNDSNWSDYNSLEGGDPKVGYQKQSAFTQSSFPIRRMSIGNGITMSNIQLTRGQRFDRGN
jgi:plastocyanin